VSEVGTTKTEAELEHRTVQAEQTVQITRRRRLPIWLAAVLGLLAGLGVAVVGSKLLSDDGHATAGGSVPRTLAAQVKSPADVLPPGVVPPGAGAATADAAITGFLDAEARADYATSFGFLSDADRQSFASPAGWVASHASSMAPITDFTLGDVSATDTSATVPGHVTFKPGLDQVVGLIPGQANVTWQVNRGSDGSWGVSLDSSTIEPVYPSDDGVLPAAQHWLADREACVVPANERAGLIGTPSLAGALCHAASAPVLGDAKALNAAQTTAIATAYGAEATTAARVVRVSGPVELGVVLVPIGDEWTVIAVLE
jgi:hypothetical protein